MEHLQSLINRIKRTNGTLNTSLIKGPEFQALIDAGITTSQAIYDLENSTSEKCTGGSENCLGTRRFVNYVKGYVPHCRTCGNWRNQEKSEGTRFDKTNPEHVKDKHGLPLENLEMEDVLGYLKNKNGKLEGQRINQKSLESKGLGKVWEFLEERGCTDTEKLWAYLNGEPSCGVKGCQEKPRFRGYRDGYMEYCRTHSRTNRILQMNSAREQKSRESKEFRESKKPSKPKKSPKPRIKGEYLNEKRLGFLLEELFEKKFVHDEQVPGSGSRFRPDYRNDDLMLVVEFDGFRHFNNTETQERDIKKDDLLTSLGYSVVRIPYFVQISESMIEHYFGIRRGFTQEFPHGFVDKRALKPCDFNSRGVERFEKILQDLPKEVKESILETLNSN